jgi:hypothetical protein
LLSRHFLHISPWT